MNYYVYLLLCADGSYYCGIALDPEQRCRVHSRGFGSKYVRARLPATLVWSKLVGTRSAALKEEYRVRHLPAKRKRELSRSGSISLPSNRLL